MPDHSEYAERLTRALGALDDDSDFRARMIEAQRAAAAQGRYEEAIRNRDGLRALDRALSSLATIREAARHDVVLVEEVDSEAVVSFIRGGLRAAVLRGTRDHVDGKLAGVIERVYFSGADPVDPLLLTPEKIAEMLIIASFDETDAHLEIRVSELDETVGRVRRALGLDRRTPRRRHGSLSGA